MNLHFYLGHTALATMPAQALVSIPGQAPIFRVDSRAFCCTYCGEVWGKIATDHPKSRWIFEHRVCRACGEKHSPSWAPDAGSFLDPAWWNGTPLQATNPTLPEAIIKWEFAGLLPTIEKELSCLTQ